MLVHGCMVLTGMYLELLACDVVAIAIAMHVVAMISDTAAVSCYVHIHYNHLAEKFETIL